MEGKKKGGEGRAGGGRARHLFWRVYVENFVPNRVYICTASMEQLWFVCFKG